MKYLPSALLPLLLLIGSQSCIKENRTECPCYLILDFSGVDAGTFDAVGLEVQASDGFRYSEEIGCEDFGVEHVVTVPRRGIRVNAYYGAELDPDRGFVVAEGSGFPPLWLHASRYDTRCDVVRDTVRLHKSYCLMRIEMLSDGSPCPYTLGVDGDVCGYAVSGDVADGNFSVYLAPDGDGKCSVRVPRQKDTSLGLSVVDGTDVLRRFALGEYIAASGYDWSSADLEDIDVTVDFARTRITLRMTGWETVWSYTVEI